MPRTAAPPARPRRVALYSHDTQGIGHVRRNTVLAASLVTAHAATDVLLLTGTPEATTLPLPARTDVVTLPTVAKEVTGRYRARVLSLSLAEVVAIREAVLGAALRSFAPDLLLVDKVARGFCSEMERPLAEARERGAVTVLGLRDVLDGVTAARREWQAAGGDAAVADLYDAVWVYGDRRVFDPTVEYGWPAGTAGKVTFTGYLAHGRDVLLAPSGPRGGVTVGAVPGPVVLCLVGGGQDGAALARTFARSSYPRGHTGVVVTGPYLPRPVYDELGTLAGRRRDLVVLGFVQDVPVWVRRAAATVSMAGYNTVCELLLAGRPALLVPRTVPRTEQQVRAHRLGRAGLVDVLDPDALGPERVSAWLTEATSRGPGRRTPHAAVDLDGLARVPLLAARWDRQPVAAGGAGNGWAR